jgi:hypothetical protein
MPLKFISMQAMFCNILVEMTSTFKAIIARMLASDIFYGMSSTTIYIPNNNLRSYDTEL